ncbi:hypothetical protein E4P41_17880 [Geodermatophilus sp. DF01-2]|nr:hypothetical protein E4P41_17880 [Geodermatophilus sp. DF01_2]
MDPPHSRSGITPAGTRVGQDVAQRPQRGAGGTCRGADGARPGGQVRLSPPAVEHLLGARG